MGKSQTHTLYKSDAQNNCIDIEIVVCVDYLNVFVVVRWCQGYESNMIHLHERCCTHLGSESIDIHNNNMEFL